MNDWRREFDIWSRTRVHSDRVERSRDVLRRAADIGRVVVSTSWGKDSTALCDLAIDTLGDRIELMHLESPYRLPGWEQVERQFIDRGVVVHAVPSRRTLAETISWLKEIGLGYERDGRQHVGARAKSDRGSEYARSRGFAVQLLGIRAEESVRRKSLILGRGALYRRKTDGWWIGHPLAWWTVEDVWAWIVARELAYHPLYDCETHAMTRRTLRNSGWLTTIDAGEGRFSWLREHFPEQWRALAADFPRVRLLI